MAQSICAARAADTLLRALGGRSVLLRVPAPAVPAAITEQLGLTTPGFQDLPLYPVVFRKARAVVVEAKAAQWELLVSANTVAALLGSSDPASASVLFAGACGVLSDGVLMEIVSATAEQLFGTPYLFRLVLHAPLAETT